MTCNSPPIATAAAAALSPAPRHTGQTNWYAIDAARALDVLEVVLDTHSHAADSAATGDTVRDPNVAQDCLARMGVPRHVARRAGSRDLRTLYLGRYPPVRLTLGAAVVLHVAQRWATIGTTPEHILGHAHDAAHRVANLTPDRTIPTVAWGLSHDDL